MLKEKRRRKRTSGKFHGSGYSRFHGGLTKGLHGPVTPKDCQYVPNDTVPWESEDAAQKNICNKVASPLLQNAKKSTNLKDLVNGIDSDKVHRDVDIPTLKDTAEPLSPDLTGGVLFGQRRAHWWATSRKLVNSRQCA